MTITTHDISQTDKDRAGLRELILRSASAATIRRCPPGLTSGQVLGRLSSSTWFIPGDQLIDTLSREMDRNDAIHAVGVVDSTGRPYGVITRPMLFDVLGRPFGRDLHRNKTVRTITAEVERFRFNASIFTAAQALEDRLYQRNDEYYLLVNDHDEFAGIFSTRDLLIYLSDQTRKDIDLATKLQTCIVPAEFNETNPCLELAAVSKMAKGVGGDFYTCRRIDTARWLLAVCDVSGKGISAALLTTMIGGMLSVYDFHRGLGPFLASLNRYVHDSFALERYLTGIFVIYDESTGACILYDLGHSYLYLFRNSRLVRLKSSAEMLPIGITNDFQPRSINFTLKRDDILVLLTDGIEDQRNNVDECHGIAPLAEILKNESRAGLLEQSRQLMTHIRTYRGSQAQGDDMTLMMLKRKDAPSG